MHAPTSNPPLLPPPIASFGVVRYIMHIGWAFLPGTLAGTLIASLAMMLTFGYVGTATALGNQQSASPNFTVRVEKQ